MKKRDFDLDLIRAIAIFSVVGVHYFRNTNFYAEDVEGFSMIVLTGFRTLFMICVPLFMLLTGYLMKDRTYSPTYYKRITRVVMLYVIASILNLLFRRFYGQGGVGEDISFFEGVLRIFSFSGAPYAWYVEMYLGFFLLIPFLNIIWKEFKTRKEHTLVVITFIILTTLPTMANNFGTSNNPLQFVPAFWVGIYPITYYYLGAYIQTYEEYLYKFANLPVFLLVWGLSTMHNVVASYHKVFLWAPYNDWNGYQPMFMSVLIFLLVRKYLRNSTRRFALIESISKISLTMYLLSYIFDTLVYEVYNRFFPTVQNTLLVMWIPIIAVFVTSYIATFIVESLYNMFTVRRKNQIAKLTL